MSTEQSYESWLPENWPALVATFAALRPALTFDAYCQNEYAKRSKPPGYVSPYLTIVRIMRSRLQDSTWNAVFAGELPKSPCFDQAHLGRIWTRQSVDDAYYLFDQEFSRLTPNWQINLTGKTHGQWIVYEREQRSNHFLAQDSR